jgi:hypothetical protein
MDASGKTKMVPRSLSAEVNLVGRVEGFRIAVPGRDADDDAVRAADTGRAQREVVHRDPPYPVVDNRVEPQQLLNRAGHEGGVIADAAVQPGIMQQARETQPDHTGGGLKTCHEQQPDGCQQLVASQLAGPEGLPD